MIKLLGVNKEYNLDGEIIRALGDIDLEIKDGEFTAIQGPSGSGKSTLMHVVGLLDQPSSGKILINNLDVSRFSDDRLSKVRNEMVGFVFQQFNLINKLTILENVVLPAVYAHRRLDFNPMSRGMDLLTRFGISDRAKSFPNKISGGQQQRVAIARALIMKPQLVLADEPTGNLDSKTGEKILELLSELNKEDKVTVVVVTHDEQVAKQTRRHIKIRDGKIV